MPEPDMSVWKGRVDVADGPGALRWHQMVKPLEVNSPPGVALIGFACDEGVRRNGGRVGTRYGPKALREALTNLAWHQATPVYDAGDVCCPESDMEAAQQELAELTAKLIREGHRPLVLGGGHETSWGTFQGIVSARPTAVVGVINIDAHLDLRADEPGNSGTSFAQIANWCAKQDVPFRYLCLGVSEASNTAALFNQAYALRAEYETDVDLHPWDLARVRQRVVEFAGQVDLLHLSLDLDVLPGWVMPAVSAPAGAGVAFDIVEALISTALACPNVIAMDVVEFNPWLDPTGAAVRTAARLVWRASAQWSFPQWPPNDTLLVRR